MCIRDRYSSRRVDAFRRALRGDPPARVEPMRVQLKPQAQAVKARPRRYDPVKTGWLASCIAALVAFGLIVWNIQAVWASPATAVRKRDTFRLVSEYQAVNSQVEQTPKVMTDLLRDLDCDVWVDDVFDFAKDEISLLCLPDEILGRLESVGLLVAAHKCTFFALELVWCGEVYSDSVVSHDPARIQGLSDMRRPQTASELMQFLQAANWLRTSLPRMAEVVEPLRVFLEQLMAGASRRTKRVASNRVIQEDAWTAERVRAWRAAQDLVAQAVPLYHPRPGCVVLMFPDASDFHWGSFLTQVPEEEFRSGVALENMSHEPLAFLSGSFKGSQLRWATVDKEGFAIVNTFRRLEYLLWGGVHIFTDHRNLTYIFNPEACVTSVTKAMAQRLENWKAVLGQYRYAIEHIPGERNCWGDLLSRSVKVPGGAVRSVAVHSRVMQMIRCPR